MCGIVGIVRSDRGRLIRPWCRRMCKAIRHRGPDDDGFYFNGPVGLGMRRLSIIDLKAVSSRYITRIALPGSFSTARSITIANCAKSWRNLATLFTPTATPKRSFTPTIRYGADCPKHLRGMFAFAIWDERTQELFLARDRVGKKPLLYAQT